MLSRIDYNQGVDLKKAILTVLEPLGGLDNFIKPGAKVLLKPNINTADPFPASSDPAFVRAVVELILLAGASQVVVGESSTFYQNTRKNIDKLELFEIEKIDSRVKVVSFDEGKWIKRQVVGGQYLKTISMPEILEQIDCLIFLPCLKTHFVAKFTGALKLGVGLMKPSERLMFHAKHTEEKIAELNLVFKPDLIIMDGRKCFISGGPTAGEVREPHVILASISRLEIDLEEIKIIQSFPGNNLAGIKAEDMTQIKRAKEIGIE